MRPRRNIIPRDVSLHRLTVAIKIQGQDSGSVAKFSNEETLGAPPPYTHGGSRARLRRYRSADCQLPVLRSELPCRARARIARFPRIVRYTIRRSVVAQLVSREHNLWRDEPRRRDKKRKGKKSSQRARARGAARGYECSRARSRPRARRQRTRNYRRGYIPALSLPGRSRNFAPALARRAHTDRSYDVFCAALKIARSAPRVASRRAVETNTRSLLRLVSRFASSRLASPRLILYPFLLLPRAGRPRALKELLSPGEIGRLSADYRPGVYESARPAATYPPIADSTRW